MLESYASQVVVPAAQAIPIPDSLTIAQALMFQSLTAQYLVTEYRDELVDLLAERIQMLGGISIAMAHDVAETTQIPRLPRGRQEVPVQLSRLLHTHEVILLESRTMAKQAAEAGDDGTNDLLVSDVIRTNEMQVWFLSEHLVEEPLVRASGRVG